MEIFDDLSKDKIIDEKKKYSELASKARAISRPVYCPLCGRKITTLCNSHSVPQFSLKYIAEQGKLSQLSKLIQFPLVDYEKGINNTGTFHYICKECDNTYFQRYESEDNLLKYPTDQILTEIAIKNVLLQLYKRTFEIELWKLMLPQICNRSYNIKQLFQIQELDVRDYTYQLEQYKKYHQNSNINNYQIVYWKILEYQIPIASQSEIVLSSNVDGKELNKIYDESPDIKIQPVQILALPLKNASIIILYYDKNDKLNDRFKLQFHELSEEDKLTYINYLIFEYTENVFYSGKIQKFIEGNKKLALLFEESNGIANFGHVLDFEKAMNYSPIRPKDVPNLLSKKYSL